MVTRNSNGKTNGTALVPAVGYIRMSTDQQQDSPARQRQDIEALAERAGYRIIRWYEDHGLTGTESSKRKEFLKLLADAKARTFSAVLLSEQSRMSREDIFDAMQHWKLLRDAGVKIVTCQRGELDFSNLGGVITAIVDQYGAREESIKLAERIVSGKRLAVLNGKRQGGAIYGYDRELRDESGRVMCRVSFRKKFRKPDNWTSRLVPSEDREAVDAVRLMFSAIASGRSAGSVARELNRRGVPTMLGKRFSATTVGQIVANTTYAGDIKIGRRRRGKFRSLFDEGLIVTENVHKPLVSRELFAKAQRSLEGRRFVARVSQPGRFLLSGILYLAGNGRRLSGYSFHTGRRSGPHRLYGLASRYYSEFPDEADRPTFRADVIERGVLNKLRSFLGEERNKRSLCAEIIRRKKKLQTDVAAIERRLSAIREKIERGTMNLALANREDVPGVSRLLQGWRDEESRLKAQVQQARGEGPPSAEALEIIASLDKLLEDLHQADREKLRFAIQQTVKRITLRREHRRHQAHRITLWDGAIELRDELGPNTILQLTDEDIPAPGRWWEVVNLLRAKGRVVFVDEVARALKVHKATASVFLTKATLSGKIRNLGHQKGWIAVDD
ncbi:MAG: recombinase family protein [Planctomycetia bacterium]|nr:recombinase family protein [Planctomycetia bacterium]